jgi:D-alanyl-D-alanine carboxypeptidase (penicillin-binding protein 5/6)
LLPRLALSLLLALTLGVVQAPAQASAPPISSVAVTGLVGEPIGGPRLTGTGPVVDVPAGVPAPPAIAAASYLLADLNSGAVLVAKAPHAPALPASTLKTLTALTVQPLLPPAKTYTAVPQDVVDGSKVGMSPGSTYTTQQMLQAMMLASGNDAATGLSRAAGGVPQTVARMQGTARSLGALDTVVKDPSGLDAPGQVTSAYDLALIARAALRVPALRQLMTTRKARFPGKNIKGKPRASFEIGNHNSLLYNYPGAIGVKNGYTVAARWTIVGAATRGGRSYVVTALTRTDRSWRPTAALLDWAFAHGATARPIGRLVEPGEVDPAAPRTPATGEVPQAQPAETPQPREMLEPTAPTTSSPTDAGPAAAGPIVAAGDTESEPAVSETTRRAVGIGGLAAAGLLVLVLALSASARRRQLRAARAARSRRRPRR